MIFKKLFFISYKMLNNDCLGQIFKNMSYKVIRSLCIAFYIPLDQCITRQFYVLNSFCYYFTKDGNIEQTYNILEDYCKKDYIAYLKIDYKIIKFIYKETIIKKMTSIPTGIILKTSYEDTIFIINSLIELGFHYKCEKCSNVFR